MPNKKTPTILVAEDDHFLAKIYKIKLAKENINAVIANDGDTALEKIKEVKPALILLDMVLPGKDGFEVLSTIKADKELRDIPVIILSNLGQDSDIAKGKELGALDYLVKSDISIHEIINKVKILLDGKR
ncbi:MAG: response regulator [Candidatus Komeilibacteria bacterium]